MDTAGFDAAMAEQKAKARAAWAGSGEAADAAVWFDIAEDKGTTEFLGYETEIAEGQIVALVADGAKVDAAAGISTKRRKMLPPSMTTAAATWAKRDRKSRTNIGRCRSAVNATWKRLATNGARRY